jgi:hypothetical protein
MAQSDYSHRKDMRKDEPARKDVAGRKDITPGHPVSKTSIASDHMSAKPINTTSGALNRGEAKGCGVGSMGAGRPRPISGCKD